MSSFDSNTGLFFFCVNSLNWFRQAELVNWNSVSSVPSCGKFPSLGSDFSCVARSDGQAALPASYCTLVAALQPFFTFIIWPCTYIHALFLAERRGRVFRTRRGERGKKECSPVRTSCGVCECAYFHGRFLITSLKAVFSPVCASRKSQFTFSRAKPKRRSVLGLDAKTKLGLRLRLDH